MAGMLTGQLASDLYRAFQNKLLTGTLRRTAPAAPLDTYGDPTVPAPTFYGIQGFTDVYSDYYRAQAGIPDTDLQVNIFAKSSPGLEPTKDDIVAFTDSFGTRWYQLRTVAVDPAGALFVCRGFIVPAPSAE